MMNHGVERRLRVICRRSWVVVPIHSNVLGPRLQFCMATLNEGFDDHRLFFEGQESRYGSPVRMNRSTCDIIKGRVGRRNDGVKSLLTQSRSDLFMPPVYFVSAEYRHLARLP